MVTSLVVGGVRDGAMEWRRKKRLVEPFLRQGSSIPALQTDVCDSLRTPQQLHFNCKLFVREGSVGVFSHFGLFLGDVGFTLRRPPMAPAPRRAPAGGVLQDLSSFICFEPLAGVANPGARSKRGAWEWAAPTAPSRTTPSRTPFGGYNGHTSSSKPLHASVPQGTYRTSTVESLFLMTFFSHLRPRPTDDCNPLPSLHRRDGRHGGPINLALAPIVTWSSRGRSRPPGQNPGSVISRRQDITPRLHRTYGLRQITPPSESISILGVEFYAGYFTVMPESTKNSGPGDSLCPGHPTFNQGGFGFYGSGKSPQRKTPPLAWSSSRPLSWAPLTAPEKAQNWFSIKSPHPASPDSFQPLQERRDVAGLCVIHQALNLHTPHLAAIKLPRPPPPLHSTRVAPHRQEQVTVPFSRTEHHLRSFLPHYGRLWNQLVHQTDLHHHASLQDFKRGVNSWLMA
ncbi:hypothetical protein GWK47_027033 [Chionoecetes opilio]|uniref:Uncharacterized protein n=1 Tax=Chionoecetes opilio TaxID=41210 RepID=A0A8J8W9U2_CHIOP|nr:hypothetical protein GWK47_027033 [Chionoecetes opilio]